MEFSKNKFLQIIENIKECYFEADLKGNLTFFNEPLLKLTGYSKEELLGFNYKHFADEKSRKRVFESFKNVYETAEPLTDFQYQFKSKNGENIICETSVYLKHDLKGNKVGFYGLIRDITERKKEEDIKENFKGALETIVIKRTKELKESEEKYRELLENMMEGYFEVDLKGTLTFVNDCYCKIFGYSSKEELIGKNHRTFQDEKTARKLFKIYDQLYKNEIPGPVLIERQNLTPSGETIYHETLADLKYDSVGNKVGFFGLIRDVTERKNAEQKLIESEVKYRNIIENAKEGYYEVDLKGNFTFFNNALCELLKFSPEEAMGLYYKSFMDEENSKRIFKAFNEVYRTGIEQPQFQYEIVTKNGEGLFGETSISLKYDSDGRKIGFCGFLRDITYGFVRDITEKTRAEQKLKESEEKYSNLFQHSNDGIIIHDLDGSIIDVNQKVLEQFGYTKSEILSLKIPQLHQIEEIEVSKNAFEEIAKKGFVRFEINFNKKNGEIFPAEVSSSLFNIGNNKFVQGIVREITERKKAEFLIKEEIQKLKELDQIRKDLISRVSHELKTPLVSIFGASELLLELFKDEMKAELIELIKMIENGSRRLNYLVNNLLDVTRIEYNKLQLEKETTDISNIIRDCVQEMMYLTKRRKLTIALELPEELYLEVDKIRIEQVILNLLSNAIKSTPPNGNIKINLNKKQNWAEISVSDTGIGLTKKEMQIIFSRFGKIERYGDGLEYIDIQGSGLGLYISKEIVGLHEGNIRAESEGRHKGSSFILKLPLN
ncbi:hypothetical protein LCGC14_1233670 [marine sediment metagenome]|uniref:histidine kinase n=1 Tax=marine sediment metagenome TaxID=412755 RepID=A0A0F9LBY2_9ZZZZ